MQPEPTNPLVILAWIVGTPSALAVVTLAVKGIFFVANAQKDLKTVVKYVHERRSADQSTEITLTLLENDVTALQENANLPTHPWPDRRVGPVDRRAS